MSSKSWMFHFNFEYSAALGTMADEVFHAIALLARAALPLCSTVLLLYISRVCSVVITGSKRKLPARSSPPGPMPWPLLGSLPSLISWNPHKTMVKLARTYGPVMAFRIGTKPTVVISSAALARDVIKTHDQVFRVRPVTTTVKLLSPDGASSYAAGGERWRHNRKLVTSEFMSIKRLDLAKEATEGEILSTLREVVEYTEGRTSNSETGSAPLEISEYVSQITGNLTSLMIVGKRLFAPSSPNARKSNKYSAALTSVFQTVTSYDVRDMLPVPDFLDLQGYSKRMTKALKDLEGAFLPLFDSRRRDIEADDKIYTRIHSDDFLARLFQLESSGMPMPDDLKKEIVLAVSIGGTFSTGIITEWVLSELLEKPAYLRRCQKLLDTVVGSDRLVSHTDLPHLRLIRAILLETLRLHPLLAFLGPCVSVADCEVGGYFLPAKTAVLINVNAINRDPAVWAEPDDFNPDRHLQNENEDVLINVDDFTLITFGAGRRSCPGRKLGWIATQMILSSFLHAFDFELPADMQPENLDMASRVKVDSPKAKRLKVIPRLRIPRYVIFPSESQIQS